MESCMVLTINNIKQESNFNNNTVKQYINQPIEKPRYRIWPSTSMDLHYLITKLIIVINIPNTFYQTLTESFLLSFNVG